MSISLPFLQHLCWSYACQQHPEALLLASIFLTYGKLSSVAVIFCAIPEGLEILMFITQLFSQAQESSSQASLYDRLWTLSIIDEAAQVH